VPPDLDGGTEVTVEDPLPQVGGLRDRLGTPGRVLATRERAGTRERLVLGEAEGLGDVDDAAVHRGPPQTFASLTRMVAGAVPLASSAYPNSGFAAVFEVVVSAVAGLPDWAVMMYTGAPIVRAVLVTT
jgi:hypothetical protein